MENPFGSRDLPRSRTGCWIDFLDRLSVPKIIGIGLASYVVIVFVCSSIETVSSNLGYSLVQGPGNAKSEVDFFDLLYFNFVTILTVGYGEYTPVLWGRLLSILEGILGVGIFSFFVAVLTMKSLLPPHNTRVFSKYGYYCTDEKRFLVIFVNTTNNHLVNVEMSSYFKLGGDWRVRFAITAPFITRSVQTFFLEAVPLQDIIDKMQERDALRFGITGNLGFTTFSTSTEYSPGEILVIRNREELIRYEGFRNVDFASQEFREMFHYHPEGARSLGSFVEEARRKNGEMSQT